MLTIPEPDTRKKLLEEIHDFVSATGMTLDALGRAAVGDGRLVERLRAGRDIGTKKLDRIRAWMAAERGRRDQEARSGAPATGRPHDPARSAADMHEGAATGTRRETAGRAAEPATEGPS